MKNIRNISFLFKLLWKHNKRYFHLTAITLFLPSILNMVQVILPKRLIEYLEISNYNKAFIFGLSMSLIILLLHITSEFISYARYKYSGEFEIFLSKLLNKAAFSSSYENFEDFSYRKKYHHASLCVKEGSVDGVIANITRIVASIISLSSLIYISSRVVWWIWIIIGITLVINIISEIYRAKYDYKSYQDYSVTDMRMRYARDKLLWKDFTKEVRLFNMYDYVTETANHYIDLLSQLQKKRAKRTFLVYLATLIFAFVQRIVVFAYIAYQTYIGAIPIADFSMLVIAIMTISSLGSTIAKSFVGIGESSLYVSSFMDFIGDSKDEDIKGSEEASYKEDFNIEFKDVFFKYPGSENLALKNISYNFQSNKKYGIVGANGSGKSTFIHLLVALYNPGSGEILYNDKDISNYSKDSYYKLFSPVFQDFNMLAYIIDDNVTMFNKKSNYTSKEAIEKSGLLGIDGSHYYTSEYEQGIELSGGESQKLAIARAIYKDAPIFIFDEPTSALSPKSEYELYESISREMDDKTIFFISHRLASCLMCDEILVFDEGEIVENGSHEELMANEGLYHKMFTSQAELYDEKQRQVETL